LVNGLLVWGSAMGRDKGILEKGREVSREVAYSRIYALAHGTGRHNPEALS
jgi:hypothetical protein